MVESLIMEMNQQDEKDLREVGEIIAQLEAVNDLRPSHLANIRSFQKIKQRILAKYEFNVENAGEMSTADYLALVRES